jgi:pimeloyl-ACP methyl ester carboxylesterase
VLTADEAYVFGCSGGALIGLDLVNRYPGQVHTLVAHEPPAMNVMPDKANLQAVSTKIVLAVGAASPGQMPHRAGVAIAGRRCSTCRAITRDSPRMTAISRERCTSCSRALSRVNELLK